ncbi:hypothetical protein ACTA71_010503 [Dictyostelium dimigraforme]
MMVRLLLHFNSLEFNEFQLKSFKCSYGQRYSITFKNIKYYCDMRPIIIECGQLYLPKNIFKIIIEGKEVNLNDLVEDIPEEIFIEDVKLNDNQNPEIDYIKARRRIEAFFNIRDRGVEEYGSIAKPTYSDGIEPKYIGQPPEMGDSTIY